MNKKKRPRTLTRVSWASGFDLCQVKLFYSEDCPAKVGMESQDDLRAKSPWRLHSNTTGSDDLPPGFERGFAQSQTGRELPYIPKIQWKCPPNVFLNPTWLVVSGEESEEAKYQKSREMRVLEAVYPRFNAIPPCPSVGSEVENEYSDDSQTPLVPITPIEEEEESVDTPFDIATPVNTTTQVSLPPEPHVSKCDSHSMEPRASTQPSLVKLPGVGADDVVAAAQTALAAIGTCNKKGSLIDADLLIKILNDPKMIQKLMNNGQPANTESATMSQSKTVSSSIPLAILTDTRGRADENSFHLPDGVRTTLNTVSQQQDTHPISRFQPVTTTPVPSYTPEPFVSLPRMSDGNSFSIRNQVKSATNVASVQQNTAPISTFTVKQPAHPIKDLNYYKNLIRQHGGEKVQNKESIYAQNGVRENYHHFQDPKPVQTYKLGELKLKNSKVCMYFKTPKGCRNGANCPYQHDVPKQWQASKVIEAHSAKRMKLNGEIYGKMLV